MKAQIQTCFRRAACSLTPLTQATCFRKEHSTLFISSRNSANNSYFVSIYMPGLKLVDLHPIYPFILMKEGYVIPITEIN